MEHLTNEQLVEYLVGIPHEERRLLGEVLRHLREVERRSLHLSMAYSSMYDFCTRKLGYSEWEAHVRIQAMRLTRQVPEAAKQLEQGKLPLTNAARAQSLFQREEKKKAPVPLERKKEILDSLCGSSTREAEKKLVELFPGEPPKEAVKQLGQGKVKVELVVSEQLFQIMEELFNVRSHANPEKRWDIMLEHMAKLAWKKRHYNNGPKESPWAPHVELH
jgi:hypothetical protein